MNEHSDMTAKVMRKQERFLTTGCNKLDAILKGGIPCQGITQIYGTGGTAKTQLALQLCLTVQLPLSAGGYEAGAVYISTEAVFPIKRLQELMHKLNVIKAHKVTGDVIFVEHVSTVEELETSLLQRVPLLLNLHKIGLLVIDSIAAPYRVEDWNSESNARSKSLRTVGQQLQNLSRHHNICVLCINQASAVLNCNNVVYDTKEQPALGITWSSMVTNCIRFYRENSLRYICISSSPYLPKITIPFEVYASGVEVTM